MNTLDKFINLFLAIYFQPIKLLGFIYNSIKEDYNTLNNLGKPTEEHL